MTDTRGERVESSCPFCDRRQFEERLIAEVDGFYIIATLGQITDGGYVLLVPKEHIPCLGALSDYRQKDFITASILVERALTEEYGIIRPLAVEGEYEVTPSITEFEHGIVGQTVQHAHFHLLPTALNLTSRIENDFPMSDFGISFPDKTLFQVYQKKPQPYLFWDTEEVGRSDDGICWNPPAPPQYLRIITAEALGRPERANWRTMDPELDKHLWSETVRRLRPYFS